MPSEPAATDDATTFPHWRRNMWALALGGFFTALGFTMPFPYLPLIIGEFGVQTHLETWVGFSVGGFFVVTFLLTPIWGVFADHYGKKSMVLRAGWGMGIGFLLMAFAPNLWVFLPMYWVTGAFAGYMPASQALAATNTPKRYVGTALSTLSTGTLIGTTLGPAIGAGLVTLLPGYRTLFFISGPSVLCAALLAQFLVREERVPPTGPFRITLLSDMRMLVPLRGMRVLLYTFFTFATIFFGSTAVVSLYTLHLVGPNEVFMGIAVERWVGAVTVALTIASAAALPIWGRVIDRLQPRRVLAAGLVLGFGATLLFPLVQDPLQLTGARLLLGLLAAGIQPCIVTLIRETAPAEYAARAMALGTAMNMLGNGGAPLIAGLVGPWLGLRAYFVLNCVMILVSLLWWSLGGHAKER